MAEETVFEAVRRLQQKMDFIDNQITAKRQVISKKNYTGPLRRLIESEIDHLIEQQEAIRCNILELKRIVVETKLNF